MSPRAILFFCTRKYPCSMYSSSDILAVFFFPLSINTFFLNSCHFLLIDIFFASLRLSDLRLERKLLPPGQALVDGLQNQTATWGGQQLVSANYFEFRFIQKYRYNIYYICYNITCFTIEKTQSKKLITCYPIYVWSLQAAPCLVMLMQNGYFHLKTGHLSSSTDCIFRVCLSEIYLQDRMVIKKLRVI